MKGGDGRGGGIGLTVSPLIVLRRALLMLTMQNQG